MKSQILNTKVKLNIGLDVGAEKNVLTVMEVKGALLKHFADHKTMTGVKITALNFEGGQGVNQDEVTAIITVKCALNYARVMIATRELCNTLKQHAIAIRINNQHGYLIYASNELANLAEYGKEFDETYFIE